MAVFAEDANVEQKLGETSARIDSNRQAGKLSVKSATDLKKEATELSTKIDESKKKNQGLLSESDKTKYCNKVKALDVKVSRAANPNRTSDEKSLAAVRKAIMAKKGLSTEAQNVKLSFEDGVLILDGTVKSEAEKDALVSTAKSAGAAEVNCKLSVTQ